MAPDNVNFGSVPSSEDIGSFGKNLEKLLKINVTDFADAVTRLTQSAVAINKTFLQGRQRIVELQQAVADAVPNFNRIGGDLADVQETITEIAKASRRNVIANTEDVTKLFAATELLKEDAEVLTNAFLDVGMSVGHIGPEIEKSIKYIQSIGGNSAEVVKVMRTNMDQLNRYQFEGGVQGLTKMAAQASMLRFDMSNTFALAEKVLSPEGAIETASAFQRLGVAAGNLVDPFQLMNLSINDPSGLQNSLADISKQFSYFDEKTKSFKINPQGVMILREMEKEAGLAQGSLSKMGLAAAELDKRLSAVSGAGLKIANEEDKQFLANIARMGEGGEYEVQIKDERGQQQTRKLSEITQQEFDKLIKEQKEGPQTLEDLARSQMNITQLMEADVSAIRNKIVGGVASAAPIARGFEGLRGIQEAIGNAITTAKTTGKTSDYRGGTENFIYKSEAFLKDLMDPSKSKLSVLTEYGKEFGDTLKNLGGNIMEKFKIATEEAKKGIKGDDLISRTASGLLSKIPTGGTTEPTTTNSSRSQQIQQEVKTVAQSYGASTISKQEMVINGNIKVEFILPSNFAQLSLEQQQKFFDQMVNSQQFQTMLVNNATPQSPTKAQNSTGFNR